MTQAPKQRAIAVALLDTELMLARAMERIAEERDHELIDYCNAKISRLSRLLTQGEPR